MDFGVYEYLNPNVFLFVERKGVPDWHYEKRQSGFHELYFFVEGKSAFTVNGHKYTAETGDIVYIPAGSMRDAHTFRESPMHAFAFNFHWLVDNEIPLPFEVLTKNRVTDEMMGNLKEFAHIWDSRKPFYRIKAKGLFLFLLNQLFNKYYQTSPHHMDPRIQKAVEYMADHYSDNLDIDLLARMTNLHPVYLGKLFKQYTGASFRESLNRIRVNNAEKMLSAGGFSVTEVAEQCGFHDISYFSKVFKSTKGYSPSAIAKKDLGS